MSGIPRWRISKDREPSPGIAWLVDRYALGQIIVDAAPARGTDVSADEF